MTGEPKDFCYETSDGCHCDHWYTPADRCCCACGAVNWTLLDEEVDDL